MTKKVKRSNIYKSSPVPTVDDQNSSIKEERIISLALWKAVAIMVTAMLGSAGAGLYGALATINSDHYTILALNKEITDQKAELVDVKQKFMPLDLSLEKWKNNDAQHAEIIKLLDNIQKTLTLHSSN